MLIYVLGIKHGKIGNHHTIQNYLNNQSCSECAQPTLTRILNPIKISFFLRVKRIYGGFCKVWTILFSYTQNSLII